MPSLQCRPSSWGIAAVFLTFSWPVPASASVTCAVRQHGQFVCTYFCKDGFTCDVVNNRCLPGPRLQQQLSAAQQAAQQATLKNNRYLASSAQQSNSQTLGYDMGGVYYLWDGDPREIPTPRYRQGGGGSTSCDLNLSPVQGQPQIFQHQCGGNSNAPQAAPSRQAASNPDVELASAAAVALQNLPADSPLRNKMLAAYQRASKRDPKNVPALTAQDLQCLRTSPQSGSDAPLPPLPLCKYGWDLSNMWKEGIALTGLCDGITDDDEYADCADKNYGTAVLTAIPDMSSYCYEGPDYGLDDMAECAKRKFKKAWYDVIFNHNPPNGCATVPPPPPPTWTTPGTTSCKTKGPSLRDRLRATLCTNHLGSCNPADDSDTPSPQTQQPAQADPAPAAPPPAANHDDDPYCAFIARRAVRGEFTSGSGTAIPDYCRKALDQAKSCEEQKCSMADIIDREERDRSRPPFHWGADDYQAIEALQK